MPNRLADATSPYLLQHAHNPVDWHPWDDEALALARREDRPIFLSIGYSACHWCHVMERESFEDPDVAAELNAHFVPIKVDREERPDLDDLFMGAVQAISGRGGWPMSVWLTPDLRPFYGGTYYPPRARQGMPGFLDLLRRIRSAWAGQREALESDAGQLAALLAREVPSAPALPGPEVVREALAWHAQAYDHRWGGFGAAPKFPQPANLELLLRRGGEDGRRMALATLDAMDRGGIRDHLGGGFARYSVDARWAVPHFEKMLYDNAQLASVHLEAHRLTGEPRYADVAVEILDYLLRDMRDPAGAFHASEDADSEGHEGRFYVFTPADAEAALGPEDGARACAAYGITPEGNFEAGATVLHLAGPALAEDLRLRLRAWRDRRVRPGRDDKIVASWNGLALSAFAQAARTLGREAHLRAAQDLARFLRRELWRDGLLLRTWRGGRAHTPAFLEDYGAVACGLLDLYQADFDPAWARWARELGEGILAAFQDPAGGFFASPARHDLPIRQKPLHDGAMPSGNALAARALRDLHRLFGHGPFLEGAEGAVRAAAPWLERSPAGAAAMAEVLASLRAPAPEVAIAGDPADPRTRALLAEARRQAAPGALVTLVEADPGLPLHAGRRSPEPCAFVCRGQACLAPVKKPDDLVLPS